MTSSKNSITLKEHWVFYEALTDSYIFFSREDALKNAALKQPVRNPLSNHSIPRCAIQFSVSMAG